MLFSVSKLCQTLQFHGLQHARPPVLHNFPELAQIHAHWVADSYVTASFCTSPFFFRIFYFLNISIRIFSNVLALHIRWLKYWSFSISPSNEYSRLISFKSDWFDLLESFDKPRQHTIISRSIHVAANSQMSFWGLMRLICQQLDLEFLRSRNISTVGVMTVLCLLLEVIFGESTPLWIYHWHSMV